MTDIELQTILRHWYDGPEDQPNRRDEKPEEQSS